MICTQKVPVVRLIMLVRISNLRILSPVHVYLHPLLFIDDDFAAAQLSRALNKSTNTTSFLFDRAMKAPFTLFNNDTGFMEAKNANGSWAGERFVIPFSCSLFSMLSLSSPFRGVTGPDRGWTEGDKWAYSFDVVHDIPTLIEMRGGNESFVKSLDAHFDGGHNDHTNEVLLVSLLLVTASSNND